MLFLTLEGVPNCGLKLAVFHDKSQLGATDIVGAEIKTCGSVVAKHSHVINGGYSIVLQGLPYAQILQESRTAGTNGINSAVPGVIGRKRKRRARLHQSDFETAALESKREAPADQPATDNNQIEFHQGIIQLL